MVEESPNSRSEDIWQKALNEKLDILNSCQEQKGCKSCFECQDILECSIRDEYVKAVYESMNKGQGGGFEF